MVALTYKVPPPPSPGPATSSDALPPPPGNAGNEGVLGGGVFGGGLKIYGGNIFLALEKLQGIRDFKHENAQKVAYFWSEYSLAAPRNPGEELGFPLHFSPERGMV